MSYARHLVALALLGLMTAPARADTSYGTLNNFDAVNDTGDDTHGFEIELEDIHSVDLSYTYDWNHYGTPRITEDTSDPLHPRVTVRYEATYDPITGTFSAYTAVPITPVAPTNGHMCTDPSVNFGCEHFGVGFNAAPGVVRYHWLVEDPSSPGTLIAGPAVNVATPTFTYYPPAPARPVGQVQAAIEAPPPPEVPVFEFGEAVWVKEIRTTTHNNAAVALDDLVSDDPDDPNDRNWANGEPAEVEVEWQIMQTEFNNPAGANNELVAAKEGLPEGDEVVTRRYEFYQYTGPYDAETHEVLCDRYPPVKNPDSPRYQPECVPPAARIRGPYIGAQMAGFDVVAPLGLIDHLEQGRLNEVFTPRTLVVGGNSPYGVLVTAGTLPPGLEVDPVTGVLSGIPAIAGTYAFTVQVTDADVVQVNKAYRMKVIDPAAPFDTSPRRFKFTDLQDVASGAAVTSEVQTVRGIDADVQVSLGAGSAHSARVFIDGVDVTRNLPNTAREGQHVQLGLLAPQFGGKTAKAVLNVGTYSTTWRVTTVIDAMPAPFQFVDVTGIAPGTVRTTAARTITDINTPVSVSLEAGSDASARVLIDGVKVDLPQSVQAGQTVQLRMKAGAAAATVQAILKVGDYTTTWSITSQ